jgi:two-component system, cell cycle sensor histidine kinase and response regulator CckA
MNLPAVFNLIGSSLLIITLAFALFDRRKVLARHTKWSLALLLVTMLAFKLSNLCHYIAWSDVPDTFKDQLELLLPFFWAILIYSLHTAAIERSTASSLRFRELALDGAKLGLWSWDIRSDYCTFDERWLAVLGYARADIAPHIDTWSKLMHPEDKPRVDAEMERHLRGETKHFEVEQRLLSKSGEWIWVRDKGRIIERDESGQPLMMAGTLQDISASKELGERLVANERLYRTVFENTGAGTIIIDEDTVIKKANMKVCDLISLPIAEIEGSRKWLDFISDEDRDMVLDYHRRRLEGDESVPSNYECRMVDSSGTSRNLLCTVAIIPGATDKVISLVDISDYKNSEKRRIEMERELRYAQRLESLGVMAAGIAHDFNNLLMVILGNADMISGNSALNSETYNSSQAIIEASRKAADICKQMLAYSGDQHLVVEDIKLNTEIRKIAKMLELSVASNAVLEYKLADNMPAIAADVMQLRQILLNLVINASEAVERDSGYITIETGSMQCSPEDLRSIYIDDKLPPGHYAFIKVRDTGIGMDANTQRHIFDPFFTTKFPGRGLGMSTVLGIVRSHRGIVKIESKLAQGTTATILLPVHHSDESRAALAGRVPSREKDAKLSGKVLLVDDDESVVAVVCAMLKGFGLSVIAACDGQEAIEKLAGNEDIACILMDLSMPRMGGEKATRAIRATNPDIPIFISSGYDELKIRQIFADMNIQGVIEKPYERQLLHDKLSAVLGDVDNCN